MWYSEVRDYNFSKTGEFNLKTGHFTQVVWRDTKEVGAGIARTENGESFVVARYLPPGNVKGKFDENVNAIGVGVDEFDGKKKNKEETKQNEKEIKKNEERKKEIKVKLGNVLMSKAMFSFSAFRRDDSLKYDSSFEKIDCPKQTDNNSVVVDRTKQTIILLLLIVQSRQ